MRAPLRSPGFWASILALATLILFCAAGCRQKTPRPTLATTVDSAFVGSAACRECHAEECKAQMASRHAHTMRAADLHSLGPLTPPDGAVAHAGYALETKNGMLQLKAEASPPTTQPLDLVLGSGKTGMTFVSVVDNTALLETKMSYFPRWRRWEITPGQERPHRGDSRFGHTHREMSRKCLGCHAVTLPADRLNPEPRFFGVGCESCHGAGRDHIQGMRAGDRSDLHLDRLGRWGATQLNEMCGKCHRTEKDIDLSSPDARQTQRFQPYALLRSACRTSSGDVLSCLTCHDPHTDARTDLHTYEAACLKCHGPSTASQTRDENVGKTCPVNSRTGCIRCHMPARNPFPVTKVPTTIVDHRISVPPFEKRL